MPKYLSGRVKRTPQSALTEDRYQYLGLEQAEPNLGDPPESDSLPSGTQYQIVSLLERPGERFWVPVGGGIIPGSITVRDEGLIIPRTDANPNLGFSSITNVNFVGSAVTVTGFVEDNGHPGTGVTVIIEPVGVDHAIQFSDNGDFAGSDLFVYNNDTVGIASVGIGTTDPTNTLHVKGDIRITGTVYDSLNSPGTQSDILVKNASNGLEWTRAEAVQSGAGGTITEIQFHGATGLVEGADGFVYDFNNNRVGIGSTQPEKLLDVLGAARFSQLQISGVTTTYGLLDINAGGQATTFKVEDLTKDRIVFSGADGELSDNANVTYDPAVNRFKVTGYNDLQELYVSGVGTIGNIQIAGLDDNTINTSSGNLKLDSASGLIQMVDNVYIQDAEESINVDTGSLIADGGVGIAKNLNVGGSVNISGPVAGVAVTISSSGGITTTGGDLYVGGDLFIRDNLIEDEGNFQRLIVNPGIATFKGGVIFNNLDSVGKDMEWQPTNNRLSLFNAVQATFGSGAELSIEHGGSGTNADFKNSTGWINFWAGGTNKGFSVGNADFTRNLLKAENDGAVELYWAGNTNTGLKLKTTESGVDISGTLNVTGVSTFTNPVYATNTATISGITSFHSNVYFAGDGDIGDKLVTWIRSSDTLQFDDGLVAAFGDKAGGDLKIYHESNNSYIRDSGAGNLYLDTDGESIIISQGDGNQGIATFTKNAGVELFHAGDLRFNTTIDGVKIRGGLQDKDGELGINGQLLQSTGTAIDWKSPDDLTVQNANKIGIGTTNENATYYPSFVRNNNHPSRDEEYLYTDAGLVLKKIGSNPENIGLGIGTISPDDNYVDIFELSLRVQNNAKNTFSQLSTDGNVELFRDDTDESTKGGPYIDFKTDTAHNYDARIQLSESNVVANIYKDGLTFSTGGDGNIVESLLLRDNADALFQNGNIGIGTTNPDSLVHATNTSILHVGVITAREFRGGEYHGVFKGSIDPGVTLDIANKANQILTAQSVANGSYSLTFVSTLDNYDSVYTGTGVTFNPSNSVLSLKGNLLLNNNVLAFSLGVGGDWSDSNIDHIWHQDDNNSVYNLANIGGAFNFVSDSSIKAEGNSLLVAGAGIFNNSAGNGFVGIGTTVIGDSITGSGSTLSVNGLVRAAYFYGDGSNLTNIGDPSAWTQDDQGNLVAGTLAGDSKDEDTCYNIMIGCCSGRCLNQGDNNIFLGQKSGHRTTSGGGNIAIGADSGRDNQSGDFNISIGHHSGRDRVQGEGNINIGGYTSCQDNANGSHNTVIGYCASSGTTSGACNTFLGAFAGCDNCTGKSNIVIGYKAQPLDRDTNDQLVIARGTNHWITGDSNFNVGIGTTRPSVEVSEGETAVLHVGVVTANYYYGSALHLTEVGGTNGWQQDNKGNLVAGLDAGKCRNCAGNDASANIFVGEKSGKNVTDGDGNIFLGQDAGLCVDDGNHNIFLGCYAGKCGSSGSYNIAFGYCAGHKLSGKTSNTYIGACAASKASGDYNLILGAEAACKIVTGCKNTFLGYRASVCQTAGCCNVIIGAEASAPFATGNSGNSVMAIGNPGGSWIVGDASFNIGIGTITPTDEIHTTNDKVLAVGIVTANCYYGKRFCGGCFYGDGSGLSNIPSGSVAPAGSNKQLQFNNSSVLGGTTGIEYTSNELKFLDDVYLKFGCADTPDMCIGHDSSNTRNVIRANELFLTSQGTDDDVGFNIKVGSNSGNDACLVISGARTSSSTAEIGKIEFRNATSNDYIIGQITARDPSGAHANKNGALRFNTTCDNTTTTRMIIDHLNNINPGANETQNLGCSGSMRWNNVYAKKFHGDGSCLSNIPTGAVTAPGSDKQLIFNNGGSTFGGTSCAWYDDTDTKLYLGYATFPTTGRSAFNICKCNNAYTNPYTNSTASISVYNHYANVTNGSTAHSSILTRTNGANSGDPFVSWDINGVIGYSAGIDNSDSDAFKLARSWTNVGTDTLLRIDCDGHVVPGSDASQDLGCFLCAESKSYWRCIYSNCFIGAAFCGGYFYGDGSNLTNVGGANAWQQDAAGNLKAGVLAGENLTAYTKFNVFVGCNAGHELTIADNTVNATCGDHNIAIGCYAGFKMTTSHDNIFLGKQTGKCVTTGRRNVAIGINSLLGNSTSVGNCNIAMGVGAGQCVTSADHNILLGSYAAKCISTGDHNIILGSYAGCCVLQGVDNIFIGRCAGKDVNGTSATNACKNIFLGACAGCNQSEGCKNIIIGTNVQVPNTTGDKQLAIGWCATLSGESPPGDHNSWINGDANMNIGIGTQLPAEPVHACNAKILNVGIVKANYFCGGTFKGNLNIDSTSFGNIQVAVTDDNTIDTSSGDLKFGATSGNFLFEEGDSPTVEIKTTATTGDNATLKIRGAITSDNAEDVTSIFFDNKTTSAYTMAKIVSRMPGTSGHGDKKGALRFQTSIDSTSLLTDKMIIEETNNINPGTHEVQDLGESNSNRWNAVWAKEFRGGTFYGTIDSNVNSIALNDNVEDVFSVSGNELSADDPNADRIVFWDDSAGKIKYLSAGSNLSISGTTLNADAGSNTTYGLTCPSGGKIRLSGSDGSQDEIELAAGNNITISRTNSSKITIAASGSDAPSNVTITQNTGSWQEMLFAAGTGSQQIRADATNDRLQVNPSSGAIRVKGNITAYRSSDIRLKDNISPIKNALDKVSSISGNTFTWNEKAPDDLGGNDDTGVIAQEIIPLGLPGVTTTRDDGTQAVMYEKLVPLLIEAIKELKEEVDELKSRS